MALLELLATAAVARIVAAHLRFLTDVWPLVESVGVIEHPLTVFLLEEALFVVVIFFAVDRVLSVENDDAFVVRRFSGFFVQHLEAEPLGVLGPFLDLRTFHFASGLGMVGIDDVIDFTECERGIASAEQLLGRFRLGVFFDDRLAARAKGFTRVTEAVFGGFHRAQFISTGEIGQPFLQAKDSFWGPFVRKMGHEPAVERPVPR